MKKSHILLIMNVLSRTFRSTMNNSVTLSLFLTWTIPYHTVTILIFLKFAIVPWFFLVFNIFKINMHSLIRHPRQKYIYTSITLSKVRSILKRRKEKLPFDFCSLWYIKAIVRLPLSSSTSFPIIAIASSTVNCLCF